MATTGPPVEVRKNPKSTTWYNATILDINGENIRVAFEDQIWQSREVPAFSVRRCPQEDTNDNFDPEVEEVVEVSVAASESNPSGWSLGKVKTIKNSFYFIGFIGNQKGNQDLIVERNALRRVNGEPPIESSKLERRLLPVDAELHSWVRSQDAPGCITHVQNKARLLLCSVQNMDSAKSPEVLMVGDERAVDLGEKLLLHIHFKNQIEMQNFHEQREQLMERLQKQQRWYDERNQDSFAVEQSLVGKIIGKKGDNIKMLREKHGVEVHLSSPSAGRPTTITVTGATAEDVQRAREEMEFITARIPIEADAVGWILGKGYQNIQDIAKKTDLHYARFDDKTSSLELCGLKDQVEAAKMLISVHREYFAVYQDMNEEQNIIQQSFDELEGQMGKGGKRSKGKDSGKDKDRGKSSGKDKDGGKGEKSGGKDKDGGRPVRSKGKDEDERPPLRGESSGGKGNKGGAKSAGKGGNDRGKGKKGDHDDEDSEDDQDRHQSKGEGKGKGGKRKGSGRGK